MATRLRAASLALAVLTAGALAIAGPAPDASADPVLTNIDRTYGTQGVAAFGWTDGSDTVMAHGMGFQSDGAMVALVGAHRFVRVTAAGTVDPAFAAKANVPDLFANVLSIDPQNRIVTAEQAFGHDGDQLVLHEGWLRVRRFLADGTPDPAFGTAGALTWQGAGLGYSSMGGIVTDSQGRVLVLYQDRTGTSPIVEHCVVARFSAAGALDTTYGTGGKAVLDVPQPPSTSIGCYQLLLRSGDGVFAGTGTGTVKLDSSGGQVAFGAPGSKRADFVLGPASMVLPDGRIAMAIGHPNPEYPYDSDGLGVRVVTADGSPDTTFSGDGEDSVSVRALDKDVSSGFSAYPGWMGRRADGKLVVGGDTISGHAVIGRWSANGTIDTSYGVGGVVLVNRSELPGSQVFGTYGGLSPDGTPHQLVQPNMSWAFSRGVARINGSANTSNLMATVDRTSGAEGTVVRIVGSGCPGYELRVNTGSDGGIANGRFGTPTVQPTTDGTFEATVAIAAEPSPARPDHTYPITITCGFTKATATAGQFHYTAPGSLWQTVRLRPLHPGEQTFVSALNDERAVGRSGTHAVWWDGAGNPHDLGTSSGCTGDAVAVNDAVTAVGQQHCPGQDRSRAYSMDGGSYGAFDLPADFAPKSVATSPSIYQPTTVVGVKTVSGVGHAAVSDSTGATALLPDLGLPSTANAISDTGYVVGTIDGLDGIAAGMPPHLAVGWIGDQVFPLVASPVTTQGIDVNEGAYALVQVTTPGDDHGVLVAPGGQVTSLNSDGLSDHVVDLNSWNLAVGRRQLTASTYAGIYYAFGQGVRLDTLVSAGDRAVWTYDQPTGTNDLLWVVGNTASGTSWLMRTPGT